MSVTISVPRRLIDALEENGLSIVDAITIVLGNRLDPHEIARARIELAEKYLEEAKDYINKKDAVQASEKMYKVVEECIKALAETLNTPETQEARKNGRWFTWLLGSAARSV
ncbi:MAG: PaREP1 family protein, partial [Vulcanisaeta sp.]